MPKIKHKKRKAHNKQVGQQPVLQTSEKPYAKVSGRVSVDEERAYWGSMQGFLRGIQTVAAKFPFEFYQIIDNLSLTDPYVNKYVYTTIALGNTGHKIELDASGQAQADAAIQCANDFAARCFPLAGGMDGVVNALLSQLARAGGLCIEWVPSPTLSQVQQAYIVPIKMLRWRYDDGGDLQLNQLQYSIPGPDTVPIGMVPLNMAQTTFHNCMVRDSNPYPIPPTIAALEPCLSHRKINRSIGTWMEKVSALGVLMAEVEPPPREAGEEQKAYDIKSQAYLNTLADGIQAGMAQGIGVGYNNIKFTFANTHASAQGAKDILQIVLQGLFGALQRDPIFFGWQFKSSEAFARVVYDELQRGLGIFQQAAKRAIEHGHRLNFALSGFGDIGCSIRFNPGSSINAFQDSEADYMDAQSAAAQLEAGIIDIPQARALLGYDELKAGSAEFVGSFNRESRRYELEPHERKVWTGIDHVRPILANYSDLTYPIDLKKELLRSSRDGVEAFFAWILTTGEVTQEQFVNEGMHRFIEATETSIGRSDVASMASLYLSDIWSNAKVDPKLIPNPADRMRLNANLSMDELGAIAYLASTVEPYYVKNFLSQSPGRQRSIESFLNEQYKNIGWSNHNGVGLFKAQLQGVANRIATNAGAAISDAARGRAEVWSQVYTLVEQNIADFKIDGPRDDKKCEYCWSMLDRVFSSTIEKHTIEYIINSGAEDIIKVAQPVAMRYRDNIKVLQESTDEEIQNTGLAAPKYHINCRDYIVGVVRGSE